MPSFKNVKRTQKFLSIWALLSLFWIAGIGAWTLPGWSKDAVAIFEFNYEITEERFPILKGRRGRVELYETQNRTEATATQNLALHLAGILGLPLLGLGLGFGYMRRQP